MNFISCGQGYFCGLLAGTPTAAQQYNLILNLLFMLTSGGLGNADAFPSFIKAFSKISPQRYICEAFFGCFTRQVNDEPPVPQRTAMKAILGYNDYTEP